jgi:microcin C transport system substrate-binding protein
MISVRVFRNMHITILWPFSWRVRFPVKISGVSLILLALASTCLAEQPVYQHGISLLHELKYKANFKHFVYANPTAPKGGTLLLSTTAPIQNFSGTWGLGVPNAAGLERTNDRLFVRSADELSSMYGLLADGVALSADRRSLFIRLHKDARWHDGVPITTRDLLFSYDSLMSGEANVFGRAYMDSWIKSLEILNDRELAIHHREVFTHSNLMALTTFPVRAAHYFKDDRDPFETRMMPHLGNGPYRIAGYDRGHVIYERVTDYWARNLPVALGRYNFDTIRYDLYRDATVAREAFRKGLFDLYIETDVRYWHSSPEDLAMGQPLKDMRHIRRWIGQAWSLAFNLEREIFQDPQVREALTLAYDFEWQNRVLQHNSQHRAQSYFAGSFLAATGLPSEAERALLAPYRDQLPERVFTDSFELPVTTGWGPNRAALIRARRLLAQAGWTLVDGRLQDANGQPFRFEIATQHAWARRLLLPYIQSLRVLGIDARLRLLDAVLAVRYKRERRFDIFLRGLDFANPPMASLHTYFSSANAKTGSSGNLVGINDPVVDWLIEQAQSTPNMETASTVLHALDRVLLWGFYHIPLSMPEEERFMYWDKFGRPNDAVADFEYLTNGLARVIDTWWFDNRNSAR